MLKAALSTSGDFVSSTAEARRNAAKAFDRLLAEYERELAQSRETGVAPPYDGDGPAGTIPRVRFVRWCSMAVQRRGAPFAKKASARLESIFLSEPVARDDFVSAVEQVYREQRFVNAAVASFDTLNGHVHNFLVGFWALVIFVAGVFLVEWGVSFGDWVVPISSTFLSFAVLLGWLPYETFGGILFVLGARPYDIGDRIIINDPGTAGSNREHFVVMEIGLLSTHMLALTGEQHTIQNFITRRLSVINLHRSKNAVITITVQLPSRTPGNKVSELIEVVRSYVSQAPSDWVSVCSSAISPPDYRAGVIEVNLYLLSVHRRLMDEHIEAARSKLYLFIHVYMLASGMEHVQPRQEVRAVLLEQPVAPPSAA
jgi:small-conductance mechanosensitive channel